MIVALALIGALVSTKPAAAATGEICDAFGRTVQGNYIVLNN